MASKKFGYVRVSTKEQNEDRQVIDLLEYGMLAAIIHEKTHWEDTTASRRFFAAPWPEENALIFDLTRPVPPRKRILNLSADDILRTYERAAQPMYPVVYGRHTASVVDANFVPVSS